MQVGPSILPREREPAVLTQDLQVRVDMGEVILEMGMLGKALLFGLGDRCDDFLMVWKR